MFFIGSHTGGQVTNNWMFPPIGTRVIQLDIEPAGARPQLSEHGVDPWRRQSDRCGA